MYLLQPRVGCARRLHAADGVQQHDSVVGQQLLHFGEELPVVRRAHMLEHAHRDDAVEGARLLAVVAQMEAHPIAQARGAARSLRQLVLLGR